MSNVEFIKRATAAVVDYFNHHVEDVYKRQIFNLQIIN